MFGEWLHRYKALTEKGILGMNARNINYISRHNPRKLFPLVDDKLKTKHLALKHGVNVPHLLGVVDSQHDVEAVVRFTKGKEGFCIKPAKGSGGKGILVIARREDDVFYKTNGQAISLTDVKRHVSNILAGLFSLGGKSDVAVVETLIQVSDVFKRFTHEGVPDLRVIVFKGFPVMAMMRLSCGTSKGKANLHQGAVGVGIDIGTGRAVRAIQSGRPVTHHPDTKQPLAELFVPHWGTMLEIACTCYDMTGLGYLGVDLVLDQKRGPMLLELNARPGLSIQVANDAGLLPRLRTVTACRDGGSFTLHERIAYARTHFTQDSLDKATALPRGASPA